MPVSLVHAAADRLLQFSRSSPTDAAAFFNWLETLSKAAIEEEHDYLISAIESAARELDSHPLKAAAVITHIKREKARCEQNVTDLATGRAIGPVRVGDGVTAD